MRKSVTHVLMQQLKHPLLCLLCCVIALRVDAQEAQPWEWLRQDIAELSSQGHRLSGTPEGRSAVGYVEGRLRSMGVSVHPLEMGVWQATTRPGGAELVVDGVSLPVTPMRPSVVALPVTPAVGLSGPMVYAGRGDWLAWSGKSVAGAVVVLEDDAADWQRAFALGASAVVFLGSAEAQPTVPATVTWSAAPVPLVRVWVQTDAQGLVRGVDLRRDRPAVTLRTDMRWTHSSGRNLVAVIPGSNDNASATEAVVLAVPLDSFGSVPERSPAARSAANVAIVLEAARRWQQQPTTRTLVLMFVDQQARGHQGAREVYDALFMTQSDHDALKASHTSEMQRVQTVLAALDNADSAEPRSVSPAALLEELRRQADRSRGEVTQRLQELRLLLRSASSGRASLNDTETTTRDDALLVSLQDEQASWDEARRALHRGAWDTWVAEQRAGARSGDERASAIVRDVLSSLREATAGRLSQRAQELASLIETDEQREALRSALPMHAGAGAARVSVVLHVSMELSDGSGRWVVSAGEDSWRAGGDQGPGPDADAPGYYTSVLKVLSESASTLALPALVPASLRDPDAGLALVAGKRFHSGAVAGLFGLYQVGFVTAYDVRPREGRPCDTLERLDLLRIQQQADEALTLLRAAANNAALTQPPRFANKHQSDRVLWSDGQLRGPSAGLKLVGGLAEDRPADGALVAVWPGVRWGPAEGVWSRLLVGSAADWEPVRLLRANAHGRFPLTASHRDAEASIVTLAALTSELGPLTAITSQATLHQRITTALRTELLPIDARAIVLPWEAHTTLRPELLKVLSAAGNTEPPPQRRLIGQADGMGFAYAPSRLFSPGIKVFQPKGPVLLQAESQAVANPDAGVAPDALRTPRWLTPLSARDLWRLNEQRLTILRTRGVSKPDLESLHALAGRRLQAAEREAGIASANAPFTQSLALSERLYTPLRAALDDLVNAVVILLLLAIPFAFALERLTVGAVTIYGRLAGFAGYFLGTFALLYVLHPGFAIAATPVLVFLAFAILLLSIMVILLLVRKFKTELAELQGQSDAAAAADARASQAAVLLAAVGMGVSTMRRRPMRTLLTATTVMVLTFTLLSFASFGSKLGVKTTTLGPLGAGMPAGAVLLRRLDYAPLPPGSTALLTGLGELAEQWWLTDENITLANTTGHRAAQARAIVGLQTPELLHWPALAAALDARKTPQEVAEQLSAGAVYLPGAVLDDLGLRVGDTVLLHGSPRTVAGQFDSTALTRLRHLDEQPVLPVDFFDAANAQATSPRTRNADDAQADVNGNRDYTRLSADQTVIASAEFVRAVGGELRLLTLDPPAGIDPTELADTLAMISPTPVWSAALPGLQRRVFTTLAQVQGAGQVLVPLLLGGLIIFGTLMGSIADREREIYTFSALGLSPKHVGALFLAEAAVYAILGSMAGQLLAQLFAAGAGLLSRAGYIEPIALNYSSTQALYAMLAVAVTVLLSALYPARRAARSANPGIARTWTMPQPQTDAQGDEALSVLFPFTVSTYDMTGVVAFLAEHFRGHQDAGLGAFAAQQVQIRTDHEQHLTLHARLALAPFDLGITQQFTMTATPSSLPGVDEVHLHLTRRTGSTHDWVRANKTFLKHLRHQFLLWRTLKPETIERYRRITLETTTTTRHA